MIDIIVEYFSDLGILFAILLIFVESIVPIMPLGIFIALASYTYGSFIGFILSYICTVAGCMISFAIVRKYLYYKIIQNKKIKRISDKLGDITFSNLVLILSLPFTPAFIINICAGLTDIKKRKYLLALIISKIVMCYFYVFIGTSLKDSISDLKTTITILGLMLIVYIVSKIITKKFKIE